MMEVFKNSIRMTDEAQENTNTENQTALKLEQKQQKRENKKYRQSHRTESNTKKKLHFKQKIEPNIGVDLFNAIILKAFASNTIIFMSIKTKVYIRGIRLYCLTHMNENSSQKRKMKKSQQQQQQANGNNKY